MKNICLVLLILLFTISSCDGDKVEDLKLVDERLIGKWYVGNTPSGNYIEFTPSRILFPYGSFDTRRYDSFTVKTSGNGIYHINYSEPFAYYEFVSPDEFDFDIESAKNSGDKWLLYQLTRKKIAASNENMCRIIVVDDHLIANSQLSIGTSELFKWELVSPDIYIDD